MSPGAIYHWSRTHQLTHAPEKLTKPSAAAKLLIVSAATLELVRICEALPEAKQNEVTDFARFLLEREADERWEAIESESQPRAKFEAFLRESATGKAEPLDPARL